MKKKNKPASEGTLCALHATLAQSYADALQHYRNANEPAPPALLSSVARFLADSGIEALPDAGDMQDLADAVPGKVYRFDPTETLKDMRAS